MDAEFSPYDVQADPFRGGVARKLCEYVAMNAVTPDLERFLFAMADASVTELTAVRKGAERPALCSFTDWNGVKCTEVAASHLCEPHLKAMASAAPLDLDALNEAERGILTRWAEKMVGGYADSPTPDKKQHARTILRYEALIAALVAARALPPEDAANG